MDPIVSLVLIGTGIVIAVGALSLWMAAKRPAQSQQRRQRDEALAAAELYTPAVRSSPYGTPVASDPCAPGLSDNQRVEAMRALLQRGDAQANDVEAYDGFAATQPCHDDELATTAPMAWKPTLPPDEAEAIERRRSRKVRVHEGRADSLSV